MFDLKGTTVTVKPELLMIPEFEAIWKKDKSRTKQEAMNTFSFIYFTCDYRSPYKKSYPDSIIDSVVKKDVLKDSEWKVTKDVEAAKKVYLELQYTQSLKTLDSAMNALAIINDYLNDFSLEDVPEAVKSTTVSSMLSNIEKLPKVLTSIEMARSKVEKEMLLNDKLVRGKGQISSREKPKAR